MAIAVGLDLGTQGVKIAVVDGTAKKPRLAQFIDHRPETGRNLSALGKEDLAALLKRIFRERRLRTANVVVAVPASVCLTREVQVPFTRDDQIRKTIKFQAESVFHSIAIDGLVVDHYKIEEVVGPAPSSGARGGGAAADRSRLLVVGLRKDVLRERLDTLQHADIDPVAVDLDVAAIFNAWTLTEDARAGKRTLVVDLGGGSMKFFVVEGSRLRALRSLRAQAAGIRIGEKRGPRQPKTIEELKDGLSAEERADLFFAEQEEGRLPVVILDEEQTEIFDLASETEEARQDILEKLLLEIDRTLAGTRLEGPIEKVLLTGGGAATDGIEKAFGDHFQAPCERLALRTAIASKLPKAQADAFDLVGATALGLALKAIGHDRGGLDFRKEEFVFQGKFEKAKLGVACALVLLFVFFFVLAYDYRIIEMRRLSMKQERIIHYQQKIYYTLFPEEFDSAKRPPQDVLTELRTRAAKLRQRQKGFGQEIEIVSTLDMLRDVAQGMEDSGKKFVLKECAIEQKSSTLQGEVDNEQVVFELKKAVNEKQRLVTLEEARVEPNKETGKITVQYRVMLREPEKKSPPGAPALPARPRMAEGEE